MIRFHDDSHELLVYIHIKKDMPSQVKSSFFFFLSVACKQVVSVDLTFFVGGRTSMRRTWCVWVFSLFRKHEVDERIKWSDFGIIHCKLIHFSSMGANKRWMKDRLNSIWHCTVIVYNVNAWIANVWIITGGDAIIQIRNFEHACGWVRDTNWR